MPLSPTGQQQNIDSISDYLNLDSYAVVAIACALIAILMLKPLMVVRNGHRDGGRRMLPKICAIVGIIFTFLVILYATGTFQVFTDVQALVAAEDTSLRTAAGIAKFCRDLQQLAKVRGAQVILLITSLYMLLQTFCIPGTVVLNAAIGAILGTLIGVPYCTLLGTVGASCCYSLSKMVGVSLVEAADARLMKGTGIPTIRAQVHKHRDDLFIYLLFLRLTPILPNWLVNLSSPVVGVPLRVFAAATFIGIFPQTYLTVRFGSLAHLAQQGQRIVSPWDTLLLAVLGAALLAGYYLKKRFNKKTATDDTNTKNEHL